MKNQKNKYTCMGEPWKQIYLSFYLFKYIFVNVWDSVPESISTNLEVQLSVQIQQHFNYSEYSGMLMHAEAVF